jgi:hypothetical protein
MNRITVEQVKEAYERKGLFPCTGEYLYWGSEGAPIGACALGVLVYDKGEKPVINPRVIDEVLGISVMYRSGFIYGFDTGLTRNPIEDPKHVEEFQLGLEDGIAARNALDFTTYRNYIDPDAPEEDEK